jgi:hypothetical protein
MHALRKWFSSIACAALLFGAMSPALSRLILAAQGERVLWAEVCTASGMVRVAIQTDAPAGESGGLVAGVDCPCCRLQVDAGLAVHPHRAPCFRVSTTEPPSPTDQWRPAGQIVRVAARPRGPPARA